MKRKHPTIAEMAECRERLRLIGRITRYSKKLVPTGAKKLWVDGFCAGRKAELSRTLCFLKMPIEELRKDARFHKAYYKKCAEKQKNA